MAKYSLRANGATHSIDADPAMPLLWVLRDVLAWTGTKYGCGIGSCGICTVWLDGVPTCACQVPIDSVGAREVTTIEGLPAIAAGRLVLSTWAALSVAQCGYCQPGQVMRAAALAARAEPPSAEQVQQEMDRVLCRCGTQPRIREALGQCLPK